MPSIGGGINLGAATVFLLADGSGLRRDLARSERYLENYQKKVEATARAVQKASAARSVSNAADAVVTATKDTTFVDQQKAMSDQVVRTTRDIARAYEIRTAAMAAIVRASSEEKTAVIRNNELIVRAEQQVQAASAKTKAIRDQLATGGPRGGALRGPAKAAVLNDPANKILLEQEALAVKNLANAKRAASADERRFATIKRNAADDIVAANNLQKASTNDLIRQLDTQVASYKAFGAAAGGSYVTMARQVETASRSVVSNITKVNQANEVLVRANNRLAANPTSVAAITAQEKAMLGVVSANQTFVQSLTNLDAKRHAIDMRAIKDAGLRANASVAAAQEIIAAREAELAAARQQQFHAIQQAGQLAGRGFAAGAVTIGLATQQAVSFEKRMVAVASISQQVADQLPSFTKRVQDLAVELGKSPTELADGLYEIAQAGFEGERAFDILNISARASVAGMTSVEDAARPLIGVINAWKLNTEQARKAMDTMFSGVQEGVFSFEDLSSQLGDNISTAKALGVSLEELMSVYIVLTRRSNSLSESTTQVNAIMNAFLKPSDALSDAIKDLTGESAQLFFRTHDLAEVLSLVNVLLGQDADAAGKLFPNIRSIRGIFGLTADEAKDFGAQLEVVSHASDNAGAASEVFAVQQQAAAFKLAVAREQLRQVAIIMGNIFVPGILAGASALSTMAKGFADLDPGVQGIVGNALLATTAFLGMVLAVSKVVAAVKSAIGSLQTLNRALTAARLSQIAATAAIVAIFAVYEKAQDNNRKVAESYNAVKEAILGVKDAADRLRAQDALLTVQTEFGGALFTGVKEFEDDYDRLRQKIRADSGFNVLGITGNFDLSEDQAFQDYRLTLDEATASQVAFGHTLTVAGTDLRTYLGMVELVNKAHGDGLLAGEDYAKAFADIDAVLSHNTDSFSRAAAIEAINQALNNFERNTREGRGTPEGNAAVLTAQLDALGEPAGQNRIDQIAESSKSAADKAKEAADALAKEREQIESLADAGKRTQEETDELLKGLAEEANIATGRLSDLTSTLAFMQQQFKNKNVTVPQILLDLQNLDEFNFKINTPEIGGITQNTLEIVAAMDSWKGKIQEVTDAIGLNSEEIGRWQGIQSTVSDAIGTEEDGYARLNALLHDGVISRKEYNDILAAGKELNDLAVIGIDDERVAQAKALVDLAAYESQFSQLSGDYKDLSSEQRGRIEALKQENVQTAILYALFLKMAERMGLVTAAEAEMWTKTAAAADPAVNAVLQELGLIPKQLNIDVTVNKDEAIKRLDAIAAARRDIAQQLAALDRMGAESDDEAVQRLVSQDFGLSEEERTLRLEIDADDQPLQDVSKAADEVRTREERIQAIVDQIHRSEEASDKVEQDIADHIVEIEKAWKDAFAALNPSAELLRDMASETVPGILEAIRPGLDDPFAWLTQGIDTTNMSFDEFLLKSRQIAGVDINFTDEQREALALKAAFDSSTAALQKATDAIGEHQQAISEYEGLQSLLDDVLGEASNNLDNWNRKLALGQATQKEFNDALKSGDAHGAFDNLTKLVEKGLLTQQQANQVEIAAHHIRETSTQGILREQAAIALNLVALDGYIQRHDTAAAGYEKLTTEQRGFISAIEDENTQTALSTALMLLQLEALGAIPEGVSKKYLDMMAKVHPALGALLDDIGLLAIDPKVDVTVQSRLAGKKPSELIKEDVPPEGVDIPIRAKEVRPSRQVQVEAAVPDLRQATLDVQKARDDFNGIFASLEADATREGGLVGWLFVRNIATRITATTQVVAQAVGTLRTVFAQGVESAKAEGSDVADAFVSAIATALGISTPIATNVQSGPVAQLSRGELQAQNAGKLTGKAFLAGILLSLKDPNNIGPIDDAALAIAATMFSSTMKGLDAKSPSGKGIRAGDAFIQGVVLGLDSGKDDVEHSGKALAQGLTDAAGDLTFGGEFSGEMSDMAAALEEMARSEKTIDFRQLEGFADTLDKMDDPTGRIQRASGAIRGMADAAKTEILNISSAGQDFGSNLEYAADQIAAFKGDATPGNLVKMSLDLRKLAESSDQLDADKLRAYADELRATGDAKLAKTAIYLDSIADDVDERARREALNDAADAAAEQGKLAAGGYAQAVKDELEKRTGDLAPSLKHFMSLPVDTRQMAAAFIAASLQGDVDEIEAQYNRLKAILDPATLKAVVEAGAELRTKGVPRGFELRSDLTFAPTAETQALAENLVMRDRAREAGVSLADANTKLSGSFDKVTQSAGKASGAVGSAMSGGGGGGGGGALATDAELPEALKRYSKLSAEVKSLTADFIRASLRGDEDAIVAEFNRISGELDAHTRDLVAAAGRELRTKGVPKGFVLTPELDLVPAIDALVASMPQLKQAIIDTFQGIQGVAGERQVSVMERFLAAFITGQRQAGLAAWQEVTQFMTEEGQRALYELAVSLRGGGVQAGKQVGVGLSQGTSQEGAHVRQAGTAMAAQIIAGVHGSLGIGSPSTVMRAAGKNAALSFSDEFVRNARQSIQNIRLVAQQQGIAFRDAFNAMIQTEDGSFVPPSFFGGRPDVKGGQRSLAVDSARIGEKAGGKSVQVNAPIKLGDIRVDGFNKDPHALAQEIEQEIWGRFVDGVGRVWAQVEGATG